MPVHGLWDALRSRGLLEEAKNGGQLRQLLQGKKVAVDLSIWAVEGQERSLQIEAKGGNIWPNYYLLMCFFRAVQFFALWVFSFRCDGWRVPCLQGEAQRAGRQPRPTQ